VQLTFGIGTRGQSSTTSWRGFHLSDTRSNRSSQLAAANGVWDPSYSMLNAGQQRMTVGNRLRSLARKGTKIKWR
jgi:hypothetical protein